MGGGNRKFKTNLILSGYCLQVVSPHFGDRFSTIQYSGPDASTKILKDLSRISTKIQHIFSTELDKPMKELSPEDNKTFKEATECHICKKEITFHGTMDEWKSLMQQNQLTDNPQSPQIKHQTLVPHTSLLGPRVRDHDHRTGRLSFSAKACCLSIFFLFLFIFLTCRVIPRCCPFKMQYCLPTTTQSSCLLSQW